jgi:hypothetical protein
MSGRSSSSPPIMELALLGGLIFLVLVSVLRYRTPANLEGSSNNIAPTQTTPTTAPNQSVTQTTTYVTKPTAVTASSHKVLCEDGKQGLNLRPAAGLLAPTAILPCGAIVTVTGRSAIADGLTWSPVTYGDRSGWVVSYLLKRV